MGTRHLLTDKQIEKAKPAERGARYILWDAVAPSLGLRVTDKGHKSFIVQRRVNGRMVKLTLGEYPALPLAKARERTQDALKEITKGVDPRQSAPKPVSASGLRRDSFEGAVETYLKREVEKNRRPRTQEEIVRPLRKLLIPRWGTLPLSEIGRCGHAYRRQPHLQRVAAVLPLVRRAPVDRKQPGNGGSQAGEGRKPVACPR